MNRHKPTTPYFATWLKTHRHVNAEINKLAEKAKNDIRFPRGNALDPIRNHVIKKGYSIKALNLAYKRYRVFITKNGEPT